MHFWTQEPLLTIKGRPLGNCLTVLSDSLSKSSLATTNHGSPEVLYESLASTVAR